MTEQPTIIPDRAAAARAARSRRSQQRWAERLSAAGWTCTPPVPAVVAAFELDAAREISDAAHGGVLYLDGPAERTLAWEVRAVDADGFRPDGVANRVTLVTASRPADPVVVDVVVRLVRGDVP